MIMRDESKESSGVLEIISLERFQFTQITSKRKRKLRLLFAVEIFLHF